MLAGSEEQRMAPSASLDRIRESQDVGGRQTWSGRQQEGPETGDRDAESRWTSKFQKKKDFGQNMLHHTQCHGQESRADTWPQLNSSQRSSLAASRKEAVLFDVWFSA